MEHKPNPEPPSGKLALEVSPLMDGSKEPSGECARCNKCGICT